MIVFLSDKLASRIQHAMVSSIHLDQGFSLQRYSSQIWPHLHAESFVGKTEWWGDNCEYHLIKYHKCFLQGILVMSLLASSGHWDVNFIDVANFLKRLIVTPSGQIDLFKMILDSERRTVILKEAYRDGPLALSFCTWTWEPSCAEKQRGLQFLFQRGNSLRGNSGTFPKWSTPPRTGTGIFGTTNKNSTRVAFSCSFLRDKLYVLWCFFSFT